MLSVTGGQGEPSRRSENGIWVVLNKVKLLKWRQSLASDAIRRETTKVSMSNFSPHLYFFPSPSEWLESSFSFMAIKYFILICSLVIHFLRTL